MTQSSQQLSISTKAGLAVRDFFLSETTRYIVKRVLQGLLTLLLASMFSFLIVQLAPGDFLTPFRQNPQISADTIADLEERFGLDRPVWVQYFLWLRQVVTKFDFGI
ncbi:MAG: ABC transporter permease, partial [Cyanobacteria bacterium P01_F01_bin.3]